MPLRLIAFGSIKMTTSSNRQFWSNMLRPLFVVLALCASISTCARIIAPAIIPRETPIGVDCSKNGSSTACAMSETARAGSSINPTGEQQRASRRLETDGFLNSDADEADEVTGRRKKKGKGGYKNLLVYFIGASKATMVYIAMHMIAALAAKALVAAKVALAVGIAALLKKSGNQDKVSYEIIKHPHYSYAQTHSASYDYDHHGGFDESGYGHRRRRKTHR